MLTRRMLVAIGVAILAACGGDSATRPTSLVGDYVLSTVNGKPLPFRLFADIGFSVDIVGCSLALRGDGSFLAVLRSEERVDNFLSTYADTSTGSWEVSGGSGSIITFTAADSTTQTAVFAGTQLTVMDSSSIVPIALVYAKR